LSPRASWKGFLKIADVTAPIGLYAAASTSERIALHSINRPTGHRVKRELVDAGTGDAVDRDDQVKGYEVAKGEYVSFEPDEIAAVIPCSDKTLTVSAFVDLADVDEVYFDKPYYLGPADRSADETFAVLLEGMRKAKVAAVAGGLLFRRERMVLIRPFNKGLAASTLNYDYEVRSSDQAFSDVPKKAITGEMLDLAVHIIKTKQADVLPEEFHDRYEDALAELVKLKLEGKVVPMRQPPRNEPTVDLIRALRESAAARASPSGKAAVRKKTGQSPAAKEKTGPPQRKAS
jgi:DNA end-binding protein Ku